MIIIDGKKIAEKIKKTVKEKIAHEKITPHLAIIIVGDDPASHLYVELKKQACREVGIKFSVYHFAEQASTRELLTCIEQLNKDNNVHAILIQLPLPSHLDEDHLISVMNQSKDVDGFHPENTRSPIMVTVILQILESTQKSLPGLTGVVLGNSIIFCNAVSTALNARGISMRSCAPTPEKIPPQTRDADIVITALGRPHALNTSHLKNGAVVIDIGITKMPDGKIVGDVDAQSLISKEGFITPVPGGVGPITIACVLQRTVELYFSRAHNF